MSRKIYCNSCSKPLGEIRDATLRKGIVFYCSECSAKPTDSEQLRAFSFMDELLNGKGRKR